MRPLIGETLVTASDDLKELVEGVQNDIYRAEQCIAIIDRISDARKPLNDGNFGDLFGSLQGFLVSELTLAMTRTFERPSKKYPNRSLPSTIALIDEQAEELPIAQRELLQRDLGTLGTLGVKKEDMDGLSCPDMNRLAAKTFGGQFPDPDDHPDLQETLNDLRIMRDKQIAHHERVSAEEMPKIQWGKIPPLLDVPKRVIGIIGHAYLPTVYVDGDRAYIRTSNAERASRALRRLLKQAKIIPTD